MLRALKDLFEAVARPGQPGIEDDGHRLQLATAVLLVEVMRADPQLGADERRAVVAALRERDEVFGGRRADLMALDARGNIVIVEIKVSRADLLGDGKWPDYLDFCDRFYWGLPPELDRACLEGADFRPECCGIIVADEALHTPHYEVTRIRQNELGEETSKPSYHRTTPRKLATHALTKAHINVPDLPAVTAVRPPNPAPVREEAPEQPAPTGDEEDLEQFNSWLHNLRKQ